MAQDTAIEWCDSTFNPWIGCTRVSPACDDCYAARSTPARTLGVAWGTGEPRRRTADSTWEQPRTWQRQAAAFRAQHGRRRRVFCASLADVFDNEVPAQWRIQLLRLILETPDLDWLLLTKRIGNAAGMLETAFRAVHHGREGWADNVPPNVWLGVTVVNQAEVERDVPKLLRVPAAVRFLSVEPMLGRVYVEDIPDPSGGVCLKPLAGLRWVGSGQGRSEAYPIGARIDWVICGGESGPKARPMHPHWARSLRDQCAAAGVPFLFKQWGEWVPADDDFGTVVPVTEIVGDVQWQEGKRVQVQWLSPNNSSVGSSFARLGKKAAGRQLDGRTHDAWPEVRHG